MHNATLLIYDSAVYLGGDRAKVCSLWLHCCTAGERLSLSGTRVCRCLCCASQMDWHIYEGFPAGWDTETGPQLIGLSFTEADIYPMHCSWTQSDARIPCAAGKIVLLMGGGDFYIPAAMIAHLIHTRANKQTHKVIQDHSRCFTCQISM